MGEALVGGSYRRSGRVSAAMVGRSRPGKIRSTLSRRWSSPMPPGHPTQHMVRSPD
jgi:hypothetical protein